MPGYLEGIINFMLLILHIMIAISSLAVSTLLWIKPSAGKFRTSSIFITLTLTSGTVLVLSTGSNLLRACATGLIYTAVSLYFLLSARNKLSAVRVTHSE